MATTLPRTTITLTQELMEQVDNYRFDRRIRTQSQAVVQLIERGLEVLAAQSDALSDGAALLSKDEAELLTLYRALNTDGQSTLIGTARGLAVSPKTKRGSVSNTETA